mmetsp:Transcript_26856/g.52576  ORF Transcript_26856/g.52576 Transcript_26856/m.52576 type:complete len:253 (+) Transcript_26856:75-833(+)
MGAALAPDVAGVCVPMAVGTAVGSSCSSLHDRLGQRFCVVQGAPFSMDGCGAKELPFGVMGVVHDVHIIKGVVGTFTNNEPVLAVRAGTLPFSQAIGRLAADQDTERSIKDRSPGAVGGLGMLQRYTFESFLFHLPGMMMQDEVVIAFGTRTVVRMPLLRASNASLDFEPLGTVTAPLARLLQGPQPVEVDVPVHPRGESLPQVARATLTFAVAAPSTLAPSADDTDAVALNHEVTAGAGTTLAGSHRFNVV